MGACASVIVGRDRELQAVDLALRAARTGRGGAVFVVGESGIGKSRLAAAAADLAFAADMRLLRGRGSTVGPMVPFRALTEALLSLLRAHPSINGADLGAYRPILGRLIPDWGVIPPGQDGGSLVTLAEAVLRLTGLAGRDSGCLIVLDDLQDADAETLAVLEYLTDNLHHQPTLLLGTVRAEPCAALDLVRSTAQRGAGVLIELDRLPPDDLRRLAASCLDVDDPDDVPEQVAGRLWADSAGNPLIAEELLGGMIGTGLLTQDRGRWVVTGELQTNLPATLARSVAQRVDLLEPPAREVLAVGAVLGRRFPLAVVQAATDLDDRDLVGHLHSEVAAQLVVPDDQTPGWYAFRHPLVAEAVLTLLTPAERVRLAHGAVDAVEAVHPGLPGEWCQLAATLRLQAGDASSAGALFADAGRRALAQGAAASAVALLERAVELLVGDHDDDARADAFEALIYALTEAGLDDRALSYVGELDGFGSRLNTYRRARMHARLAWAANIAGRSADGLAQVELARALLGPDAPAEHTAPIDVVAAHLMLDLPGQDQHQSAEATARRAAAVAEAIPLPVVACQAWQLLGALALPRDVEEAAACLERARSIAVRHHLPIWEIHALVRLGNHDALRTSGVERLEQAKQAAQRAGAVTASYHADANLGLQAVLRGDFAGAGQLLDEALTATTRLNLRETTQYLLLNRAVLAGHQARRREMDAALAEFHRWGGDDGLHAARVYGLARTFCALLEEDRPRALAEMAEGLVAEDKHPVTFHLGGQYGLHPLLRALAGEPDESSEVLDAAPGRLRWNRQFALLSRAVRSGRAGRAADALAAVAEASRAAQPYAMARHLGLRLVGEAALADGWGTPVEWLRVAEQYFHEADVPAVASACRALLRRAGVPVTQRRAGTTSVPLALRSAGVTAREYEILLLLADRLGNREIADRLHLSPRTVEKHVASLIGKTQQRNRLALGDLASAIRQD
jgi:DNA-binding CsgD family transcriptional regulator